MQALLVFLLVSLVSARLSDDKCKEYHQKSSSNDSSLINEFPHMGLLGFTQKEKGIGYKCPATLISDSFVIAPAFCITSHHGEPTHVLLGTLDYKNKGDKSKLLEIVNTIIHPDYNKEDRGFKNSLALIKFSPPIISTDYIRPGCLYTKAIGDSQNLVDLLWEKTADSGSLYKIDSSIVPISTCKKTYEKAVEIDEHSHLCVVRKFLDGYKKHFGGTSHVYEDNIPKIVAIDNFGPKVPTPEFPDITTNVYNYLDWIEKNVWSS